MKRIEQLKLELSKAIKESPDYDPYFMCCFYEFSILNFDFQISGYVVDIFAAQEDLNNRYADMRRQDMVNRYLLSEVCLCRMVQDICRTVVETIEFDVDFLNN